VVEANGKEKETALKVAAEDPRCGHAEHGAGGAGNPEVTGKETLSEPISGHEGGLAACPCLSGSRAAEPAHTAALGSAHESVPRVPSPNHISGEGMGPHVG
jgi:hypothetical protein